MKVQLLMKKMEVRMTLVRVLTCRRTSIRIGITIAIRSRIGLPTALIIKYEVRLIHLPATKEL